MCNCLGMCIDGISSGSVGMALGEGGCRNQEVAGKSTPYAELSFLVLTVHPQILEVKR